MSYDEYDLDFRWTPTTGLVPAVPAAPAQRAPETLPWVRDISAMTIADLMKLNSDQPGHRNRTPIVVNGQEVRETLKERLTRETAEIDAAVMALVSKRIRREKQLEHLAKFPDEDPFIDGDVIWFEKSFPNAPDVKYTFSAVRIENRWHVTGTRSPNDITWPQLVNWMGLGVDEIWKLGKNGRKKIIG